MKLDGVGLFVNDMATMVRFYRDVLGFESKGRFLGRRVFDKFRNCTLLSMPVLP